MHCQGQLNFILTPPSRNLAIILAIVRGMTHSADSSPLADESLKTSLLPRQLVYKTNSHFIAARLSCGPVKFP